MTPAKAHLLLLFACALWGSGNVAQKTILEHMGPFMATGLTCLIGSAVLLPMARREAATSKARGRPGLFELSITLLCFAAAITALQVGYAGTSVTNAGFLVNTATAMTPIAAWFVLKESPTFALIPSILLVLLGVWLMGGASFTQLVWGDFVCLVSAVFYAFSVPLVSRYVLTYGKPAQLTVMQFLVCGVLSVSVAFVMEPVNVQEILRAWPELLMVGIVSKGLAYFLIAFAQQHTTASATSILGSSEAIFGALFAALLLGERLTPIGLSGAGMILLSIVLLNVLPQYKLKPGVVFVERVHKALPPPAKDNKADERD